MSIGQVLRMVYFNGYDNFCSMISDTFPFQHFYLSRIFGFSLYFPLCISSSLDAVEVAMFGFIPSVLVAISTFTYIVL